MILYYTLKAKFIYVLVLKEIWELISLSIAIFQREDDNLQYPAVKEKGLPGNCGLVGAMELGVG